MCDISNCFLNLRYVWVYRMFSLRYVSLIAREQWNTDHFELNIVTCVRCIKTFLLTFHFEVCR